MLEPVQTATDFPVQIFKSSSHLTCVASELKDDERRVAAGRLRHLIQHVL